MSKQYQARPRRNYRNMTPSQFHALNQRVVNGLTQQASIPVEVWAANPTLLSSYLSTSEKYDAVFHEASLGSRLAIAQRDILQAQLVVYLDEIALVLEAASIRNPEILPASGFDLTKERRTPARAKAALPVTEEAKVISTEHPA